MGFIKAPAGPGKVLRPLQNGLSDGASQLPTRVPAAASELGLCLVLPLLKTLFLLHDFCAAIGSRITFCSITTPFIGFSANDRPLYSQTHHVSFTYSQPLSSLLCHLPPQSALVVSLSCPAPSLCTKCLHHTLSQLWWLCVGLSVPFALPVPSPPGLFLLLFMLWNLEA